MSKLIELSTEELLKKFGSGKHKPGSGSAAAFQGMLSAKLIHTVIDLTLSRESNDLMNKFINDRPWKQRTQKMWDKEVLTPRLTAWYGDRLEEEPIPWTPELLMIKKKVEPLAGVTFNSVLLNYYRDGN